MLQLIVYGLISGSILALGAIGLTLIYGILNFANFAHGDLMALGAYLVLFFRVSLALPMWLSFILGVLCTALLGVCLDRVWFRPLRQRQARAAILAISSLGLALILQNLIRMLWGPQARYYSGRFTSRLPSRSCKYASIRNRSSSLRSPWDSLCW